ncbi:MAG: thiolase family protein [Sphingobium sp.]
MSESSAEGMPPADRALARKAAIVGLGETDYHRDYQAAREAARDGAPGHDLPTPEGLAATAFERALADSGLGRDDIDGISVSFLYGGPDAAAMGAMLGLDTRYAIENGGIMAGPLPIVCADIAAGRADTVAMIYAVASRAIGRQYGGSTYGADQEKTPASYYYYHPWGWSSQAAHWAMVASHYHQQYGTGEEDLGAVAIQLRRNATGNPNAVMQAPLSLDAYMASRYIVRPLHLFDMCLVNDGAVCLIVRRADLCGGLPHAPVLVSGWGEAKVRGRKLRALVRDRLRPQLQDAGRQAMEMAGVALSDIGHFEGYDAASIHLVDQVEGYGFVAPGQGLHAFRDGALAVGGQLPVNTAGGMMSEAYMHGWNNVAEVVRQLRHEAGDRQIEGLHAAMSSLAQTDQAHPIIYQRGA